MGLRVIEVIAPVGHADTLHAIAEQEEALSCRTGAAGEDGLETTRILALAGKHQGVVDKVQHLLSGASDWRLLLVPVEATLPPPAPEIRKEERRIIAAASREELINDVAGGAEPNLHFALFVVLSVIVAAIGMIYDNVAVVIGAMVIAPLLGPNLAFALGAALGDLALMRKALVTSALGFAITLAAGVALGAVMGVASPGGLQAREIMSRTEVDLAAVALALASGAAAALSLTTGLSSALVGVMVAVALLPPATVVGLMLGAGEWALAGGAATLLAVNVASVNLATLSVFWWTGVSPRTFSERARAQATNRLYALACAGLLAALVAIIIATR